MTKFIIDIDDIDVDILLKLVKSIKKMGFLDVHIYHKSVIEIRDELSPIEAKKIMDIIDEIIGLENIYSICINR